MKTIFVTKYYLIELKLNSDVNITKAKVMISADNKTVKYISLVSSEVRGLRRLASAWRPY